MSAFLHPWHEHLKRDPDLHVTTFFGEPVVLHCHHYNLFLDQTVEDPPYVPGRRILLQNAYEAATCLLKNVRSTLAPSTPEQALDLFVDLLAYLGLGRFQLLGPPVPGKGKFIGWGHYSEGWVRKYRGRQKRDRGVEYFVRGFLAAAVDIALEQDPGQTAILEVASPVLGDEQVVLEIARSASSSFTPRPCSPCTRSSSTLTSRDNRTEEQMPPFDLEHFVIELSRAMDTLQGDEQGWMQGYNVMITRHLLRYYNGIMADFYLYLNDHHRDMRAVGEALLEESGHVCVFHTFGNLLSDSEVKERAGGLPTPEHWVFATTGVARALGFGDWKVTRLDPGKQVEFLARMECEGLLFREHPRKNDLPLFFMPGATAAGMNLAYRTELPKGGTISIETYNRLMMGLSEATPFHGSWVQALHRGDPVSRTQAVSADRS